MGEGTGRESASRAGVSERAKATRVSGAAPGRPEEEGLLRKAFEGEVLGEAYFARLASLAADEGQRRKLEALASMERCTRGLLRPQLERRGIEVGVEPSVLEGIRAIEEFDWEGMLRSVPLITRDYLECYRRLADLVSGEDARVVELLIAHEQALEEFARRELSGEGERSLEPIRALPHVALPESS